MANKITAEVTFNYHNRTLNKNIYTFTNNQTGEKYRWITSLIYNLIDNQQCKIEFLEDNRISGETYIVIKNVDVFEYKKAYAEK